MKRKIMYVSVLIAGFSLGLNSCGGSKADDKASVTTPTTSGSSAEDDETSENTGSVANTGSGELNVESLTTAQDASNKYKEMIAEYAEIVKTGTAEEKAAFKEKMTELESYAKEKFTSSELKAMLSLTKLAVQLEAGKMVDLDAAFKVYGNVLGESMKLLNSNEDMKEAIGDATEKADKAMKGAKKDVEKAMKGAGKDAEKLMQDAYDAYKY
jgi:hypothetical protein